MQTISRELLLAATLWALCFGCESQLEQAFSEVRRATPFACVDYCEARLSCELPSATGEQEAAAHGADLDRCVVECGWYAGNGAYVSGPPLQPGYTKEYFAFVDGDGIAEALECLWESNAYWCDYGIDVAGLQQVQLSATTPVFAFRRADPVVCERSGACLEGLGQDIALRWDGVDGCVVQGVAEVEVPFFSIVTGR